jgi:hypothetical protein
VTSWPAVIAAVPCAGWVTAATVSGSRSTSPSLAATSIVTLSSSSVAAVSAPAVGASLTAATVTWTVAVDCAFDASFTV